MERFINRLNKVAFALFFAIFFIFSQKSIFAQSDERILNIQNQADEVQNQNDENLKDENFQEQNSDLNKNSAQNKSSDSTQDDLMSLKEIDKLLVETDYSKALIELSKYATVHPEQRDIVQKKIDRVMNSRSRYMILANKLFDVMEVDPENEELKLEIIAALEMVEKNPTEEQLKFIKQVKIASQFTYYRSKFRHIIEDSQNLVNQQKYVEAVALIQTGFGMYKKEFYEEQPNYIKNQVTKILDNLNLDFKNFDLIQARLSSSYEAFVKAINSSNYKNASQEFLAFSAEMNELASIRNEIYAEAESLEKIFLSLQKRNPELTEASFLPFIFRFVFGLENSSTGIIGAVDTQFFNYIENLKPLIFNVSSKIQLAQIDTTKIDFVRNSELPKNQLENISNFSLLALDVNALYKKIPQTFKYKIDDENFIRSMNYSVEVVKTLDSSFKVLANYQNVNETVSKIQAPENALSGIRSKNPYATELLKCYADYSKIAVDSKNLSEKNFLENVENSKKSQILENSNLITFYEVLNNSIYENASKKSQAQLELASSYFALATNEILAFYQTEYKNANDLLQNHYPQEALDLINKTNSSLDSDSKILALCRDTLQDATKNSDSSQNQFSENGVAVLQSIQKMNDLKNQSAQTVKTCNSEILLSQRILNEADLRYNQALTAFRRNNYESARKNIELSSLKYNESFTHQESEKLRAEVDKKLIALGEQINDAENKIVIAEVRKLKNQAKQEYYNGNFERAENLLSQAKSRWAITNGDEEDLEIKNLLALVETALSMKTGRVILPTAPLYPEMSQILSIAHQFFNQGSAALKQNRREEGVKLLTQAKSKLQEVQLVYPLNQEASLLTLRIDQLIDPVAFEESFVQKLNSAKANYKIASRQQTSYTDLLDLYEIRPNYPGLKTLIYNIEIEIGVRQKPIDNSAITRSTALLREAESIIKSAGNNQDELRRALSKLDQAIALNPNNDSAILQKDRVQISLGGRASVVLSSADESKYQQAILRLQENNYLAAYALVEQLKQNPYNRRSAKILDLEKKVNALL